MNDHQHSIDKDKPIFDQRGQKVETQYNIYQRFIQYLLNPADVRTRRNRANMLEKVNSIWIEDFLNNSLQRVAFIELGMYYRPDAVEHPWNMIAQQPDLPNRFVAAGTKIIDIFDEFGGELLILGIPGSGKTTILLELTRSLIHRAQNDESLQIPIIFNLSSWSVKRQPILRWLIDELKSRYDVPKKVAIEWIENDHVLPLLDGLDEVKQEYRDQCVEALNLYKVHREHNLIKLVICSRISDYEALSLKLRLHGAILLQPLTSQQIDEYLQQRGEKLTQARRVLQQLQESADRLGDVMSQQLARTPLILSVAVLAYGGDTIEPLTVYTSPSEQLNHLYTAYVKRMFERRAVNTRYTTHDTTRWLTWLSYEMIRHGQTVFLLERMQPSWLSKSTHQLFYVILSGLLGGISVGIFGGLISASVFALAGIVGFGPLSGLIAGVPGFVPHLSDALIFLPLLAIAGLSAGSIFAFVIALVLSSLVTLGQIRTSRSATPSRSTLKYSLIGWIITVLFFVLLFAPGGNVSFLLLLGSIYGLVIGVFVWLLVARGEIQTAEVLRWSWPGRKFRISVELSILTGVLIATVTPSGLVEGIGFTLFWGLLLGLLFGISSDDVRVRSRPNEGIRRSLKNGIVLWLVGGLVASLTLGIGYGLVTAPIFARREQGEYILGNILGAGVTVWLLLGPLFGLYFGGLAVIQHAALRLLLFLNRNIPWNYVNLLDYADYRIFLRKIGGGYSFVHRTLMEYFARGGKIVANTTESQIDQEILSIPDRESQSVLTIAKHIGLPIVSLLKTPIALIIGIVVSLFFSVLFCNLLGFFAATSSGIIGVGVLVAFPIGIALGAIWLRKKSWLFIYRFAVAMILIEFILGAITAAIHFR